VYRYIALVKSYKTPPMEWFVKVKEAGEVISPLDPSNYEEIDSVAAQGTPKSKYFVGQRVEARYCRGPRWYHGFIAKVRFLHLFIADAAAQARIGF